MDNVLNKIFDITEAKGLKDVSLTIKVNLKTILYVGEKDRMIASNPVNLLQMLKEEKADLSWMNN